MMPSVTDNSPIQRLDLDILWCIIKMNADMFNDSIALNTTLATSLVCKEWYSFMINTTSIWAHLIDRAHLIDLDHRLWYSDMGSREMIRRSGTALLWVKLHRSDITGPEFRHFILFPSKNWTRIQRLEISTPAELHVEYSILRNPAPNLESFSIVFDPNPHYSHEPDSIFIWLFNGTAPLLRELRFVNYRVNSPVSSPWLQKIVSLELRGEMAVSETLSILMLTENLTNLQLHLTVANNIALSSLFVSLPKLVYLDINIYDALTPGIEILDHICIPPTCSVTFSGQSIQRRKIERKSVLRYILRSISTFAGRHLERNVPRQLSLSITAQEFKLVASAPSALSFTFSVKLANKQVFPEHTLTLLLGGFTIPGFSNVTLFECKIIKINHPIPGFTAFMGCISFVNTISTDKWSLHHLRFHSTLKGVERGSKIPFPALKNLKIVSLAPLYLELDDTSGSISQYVMERIGHGYPLSTVDFTNDLLDILPDMAFLQTAEGLKVLWRRRGAAGVVEYICGKDKAHLITC